MPTYTYSGLHPRDGAIPVHTFYCDGGDKPVVAMKSSIVIDGQSLQKIQFKEATFMLDAFQHFYISDIYTTNQHYNYALLVENLENESVPDKLAQCVSSPSSTYIGIILDYDQQDNTYTVGCGPRVFTNVVSEFSCTDPLSEFSSVQIRTCDSFMTCDNICDYEADITCMMDCFSKDLSPASSCSTLHDTWQCPLEAAGAAAMPLRLQIEASSTESLECRPYHRTTETEEPSASSACSLREETLMRDKYNFPLKSSNKPDLPTVENESPKQAGDNSSTLMSLEEFEAYKPTISRLEKRNNTFDDELTVTVTNKHTFQD